MKKDQKIKVTYADGVTYSTTPALIRKKWKDEDPQWVDNFLKTIDKQGYAYTRFGTKYEKK